MLKSIAKGERMKKIAETEWLIFKLKEEKAKTNVYSVISKCSDDELGIIEWYPAWRHYCFFPNDNPYYSSWVFSDRCLLNISEFITKLNEEHKNGI